MAYKQDILRMRREHPELTYQQIADRLGCAKSTVRRACSRGGLPRPQGTYKHEIIRLRMTEPDLTYREIAARVGCRESYVADVCFHTGLKSQAQRSITQSNILKLGNAALRAGLTIQQIEEMANARHA